MVESVATNNPAPTQLQPPSFHAPSDTSLTTLIPAGSFGHRPLFPEAGSRRSLDVLGVVLLEPHDWAAGAAHATIGRRTSTSRPSRLTMHAMDIASEVGFLWSSPPQDLG